MKYFTTCATIDELKKINLKKVKIVLDIRFRMC